MAFRHGRDAQARMGGELGGVADVGHPGRRDRADGGREARSRAGGDRGGDRVLGPGLGDGGESEQFGLEHAGSGEHVGQRHPADRERAGLVQHHGVHPTGALEDLGPLDQDAELRPAAGADQDRGRGGQAHRARAGDDQHRHGGGEGGVGRRSRCQPARQRRRGDHEHDRDEDRADPVGQALHGRLARLSLGDEPGELGELGVGPDPGGQDQETAPDVHAAAGHRVARADLGRNRLPGQHRRVHRRAARDDGAVGRYLLPRPDDELLPHPELPDRDADLASVPEHGCLPGPEVEQRAQGRACAPLRPRLQVPAEQDQRRDPGRHLQVGGVRPAAGQQQRVQRPQVGGGHAQRDQGVHGRGAVPRADQGSAVERPRAPGRDRRRRRQRCPAPVRELQRGDHRQQHDGDGERDGNEHPQAQLPARPGRVVRVLPGVGRRGQRGGVAGAFHRRDQVADGQRLGEGHPRRLGREVDRRGDAVEPVQLPLDPGGAGRAGHAPDDEVGGARRAHS